MCVSTCRCTEPPGSMPELRPRLKDWMQAKNGFGSRHARNVAARGQPGLT